MIKFIKSLFAPAVKVETRIAEYKVEAPVAEVAPVAEAKPAKAKKAPAAKKPRAPRKPKASK